MVRVKDRGAAGMTTGMSSSWHAVHPRRKPNMTPPLNAFLETHEGGDGDKCAEEGFGGG